MIALLTLLARSYYDTHFILVEEFSPLAPGIDTWWIIAYTAIVGGNIAILLAASSNGRGAWIALLVYNLVTGLAAGAGSLVVYLSNTLELVIFTASLITGVPAALSVGFRLRRGRVASRITAG